MTASAAPLVGVRRLPDWAVPAFACVWYLSYVAVLAYTTLRNAEPSLLRYAMPHPILWGTLALSLWAARRAETPRDARGWRWIALSQLVSALVIVRRPIELFLFGKFVSPDWVAVFVTLQVPCLIYGIHLLGGPEQPRRPRSAQQGDVVMMIVAAIGLLIAFGIWPTMLASRDLPWNRLVAMLAAPLGWVAVLTSLYAALRRPVAPARRYALTLLLIAFLGRFVSDTVLVSTNDTSSLVGREVLLMGWGAAIAVQLLAPWVDAAPVRRIPAWIQQGLAPRTTLLAGLAVTVMVLFVAESGAYPARTMPLALGIVLVMGLVMIRHGQHERALERARLAQARQKELESIGHAAASTAHDFGNLLMLVDVNASMLRKVEMPSEARELVTEIGEASARGAALSRRLMRLGVSGSVEREPVLVDARLHTLTPLLRRMLPAHITLHTELHAGEARVVAAAVQLEQVVLNLAWNARDAMPDGGMLTLSTRLDAETLCLGVRDTGIGMDSTTKTRIFERHFSTKPDRDGHGIGLATVWDIVTELGGHIQVESALGEGTLFEVHLPLSGQDMLEHAREAVPAAAAPRPLLANGPIAGLPSA